MKPDALIVVDGEDRWRTEALGPWDPGRTDAADRDFIAHFMRRQMNYLAERVENRITMDERWLS